MRGQSFALLDIEDDKAFQKWHDIRRFAGFGGALALGLGNEAVGVTDGRSLLAAPHMTAKIERLPKVSHSCDAKPRFSTASQRIKTLMPE